MAPRPRWVILAESILGPMLASTSRSLEQSRYQDFDLGHIPVLALYHLASSLQASMDANLHGKYSVCMCLMRQAVEALTLIDVGLQDMEFGERLLAGYRAGKQTSGELRKELEKTIWPGYGIGLWSESWSQFFGTLAKAVQPYAHCSLQLLQWQLADVSPTHKDQRLLVGVGLQDAVKASRITLLHALVIWTLGRLLLANRTSPEVIAQSQHIASLGSALAASKLLFADEDWSVQMLPLMYFRDGHDWRDE